MTGPRTVSVLVAAALTLPACGAAPAGDGHGGEHVAEPVEGARDMTVTAVDIDFEPAILEMAAGEPVNVTVVNEGETLHDFTLEAAGVHVNVEPRQEVTTSIVIAEPGTYQAVCTVPGHADAGMVVDVNVTG